MNQMYLLNLRDRLKRIRLHQHQGCHALFRFCSLNKKFFEILIQTVLFTDCSCNMIC